MPARWSINYALLCSSSQDEQFARSPLCRISTDLNFTKAVVIAEAKGFGWKRIRGEWFCPHCADMQPVLGSSKGGA